MAFLSRWKSLSLAINTEYRIDLNVVRIHIKPLEGTVLRSDYDSSFGDTVTCPKLDLTFLGTRELIIPPYSDLSSMISGEMVFYILRETALSEPHHGPRSTMRKISQLGVLVLALVLATGLIGASSFTNATLNRQASIDVVSDTNGFIGLADEHSSDIVSENADGALTIDFAQNSASGVNVNSTYEIGVPDSPSDIQNQSAFSLTNNDGQSHTITLNYSVTNPSDVVGDSYNSTEFQVFNSTGSLVATISEEDSGVTLPSLSSGSTYYVVLVVDTTPANVESSDDLSGTLEITAT